MKIDNTKICKEVQEQLDNYEFGLEQSDLIKGEDLNQHLACCDSCRNWLTDWELVKLRVKELPQLDAPQDLLNNIMYKLPNQSELAMVHSQSHDLLFAVSCFAVFLMAFVLYAATNMVEAFAWCLSFILLFVSHELLKIKNKKGDLFN